MIMGPPTIEPQRSRHLSPVRRAEAQGGRLGGRAASRELAAHVHRRAHHRRRPEGAPPSRQARRLHPPLHPRHRHRRRRGQARVQDARRRPAAGQGLRRDPRPQVRLRHQRPRHRRVRLHHRPRDRAQRLPHARRPLAAPEGKRAALRRGRRHPLDARLPPSRKPPRYYQEIAINRAVQAILKGQKRVLLTMATGTGKTVRRLPDLLEALDRALEPHGRASASRASSTSPTATSSIDDPKDKTFAPFGDARHKIEGGVVVKSREMYFAIYQAIAKDEAAARPLPRVRARLLRPHHRRRVPPRQRPRREQLARDPRILRARLSARHDGHAAARRQPRHLPLLRQPDLHLQPAPGHRRRLPRPLPRPPRRHRVGRRRLAAQQGRARPLRPRSPTRSTRPATSSASSPCAPAPRPSPATSPTS